MAERKVIILIGAPGSGKGTQAKALEKKFGFVSYSPGDIFRDEIKKKTKLGLYVAKYVRKGLLVPDNIVSSIIIKRLMKIKKGVILDGFPRNLVQVKLLHEYLQKIKTKNIVLHISLSVAKATERIIGRQVCEKCGEIYHDIFKPAIKKNYCDNCKRRLRRRIDENPKIIEERWHIYKYETKPIVGYYKNDTKYSYRKINADQKIGKVAEDIKKILNEIK